LAAAHDNNPAYHINTGTIGVITGHPDDRWGFAVQGAVSLKPDAIAQRGF